MAVARTIGEYIESSSWIRKMFEEGRALKAQYGQNQVYDYSLGNPDLLPPNLLSETLAKLAKEGTTSTYHGYMPNAGYPFVTAKIAEQASKQEGLTVPDKNIVMSSGAGGAINVILKTILDPGDAVICPSPFFPEYQYYVANHHGRLLPADTLEDFELDIESIERLIDSTTKAVLINSPNNPTGAIYSEQSITGLGQLLREKSKQLGRAIYLISDDPYHNIVFDGKSVPSILDKYENSFLVYSYSKQLSIAGERIGWICLNPSAEDSQKLIAGLSLSTRILGFVNANGLMQRLVAELGDAHADLSIYEKRRNILCDALEDIGYEFQRPQGTFYVFPRAPGKDDLEIVEALREERILAVPGRGFGAPGYFRLSLCLDEDLIKKSVPGFKRGFESIKNHVKTEYQITQ